MLDFYQISELLTSEELQIQNSVRDYVSTNIDSNIAHWWSEGTLPSHLITDFGSAGLLGANLSSDYGMSGISNVAYGLVMYELEKADSGLRSFVSVQGALVMYPILTYGSQEQRDHYLPKMAKGELVGCFGLTEPDGGSDPGAMSTVAYKDGDHYILNGIKMWITNGTIADVALIWARDENQDVRGFLVDTNTKGFQANQINRKLSLRVSDTAELVLNDVRVHQSNMLPGVTGLKGPLSCLTQARFGISWGALGALEAVYLEALAFAQSRKTFGQAIASRQLVQAKLADMLSNHTKGLLLAWRLARLKDQGKISFAQVSLAKRDNVRSALLAARSSREILAASGVTLDYQTIRHMLNLETVDTYEGTFDIHSLILGRDITGFNSLG
ncbi:acyl-CoA dehydrogenase [SAR202 cluster bacterium AC-409-J13_OGT_754m]|nr:acyl-CoA dehydrogenase [SAR202 cluster bacterium AC-409-J13_OGT_754m]